MSETEIPTGNNGPLHANPMLSALRSLPALVLLACALPCAATPSFTEQALFVSGQNGYNTYRIPAIARTKSGALLAFCEGRKNSSSDTGNIDLLVRRSVDNGGSWSPQQIVWDHGGNTCGNPAPVVDLETGTIWLLSTWNLGTDSESTIITGTSTDTRRVFALNSTDDGLTWSAATEITGTAKQSGWTWYATGPGAGIQLRRGNQAGRLLVACDHIRADNKAFGSHVVYSDDHGATWRIGGVAVTTATVRPNENLAVELVSPAPGGGSRVFFNARDHQSPAARATTFSSDGGSTYAPADFTDASQFVTPTVQGGLTRCRATDAGDSSNRFLFSCPNGSSRNRISIWSSADEAVTWSAPKAVFEGPSAYSDMTRLDDGLMGLLVEKGASSAYETITLVRFNEEWLDTPATPAENPGAGFWNFEQTPVGQNISTAEDSVLDVHPENNSLDMTATAAFPVIAGAPGYGNGRAVSITGNGGIRILDSDSANRFDFGANQSFTIEIVCRIPSGSTQVGALVAKDLAALSPSWWLRVESGKARFLVADNTVEPNISSAAAINTGQWVHVAAVRDATNPAFKQLRVYINGTLSGTATDTTIASLANGQPVWVGRYNAGTRYLTGDIDLVRITPAALAPLAFVAATTQFDADADGIPDDFERSHGGGLSPWNATHLGAYVFGSDSPSGPFPVTGLTIGNGTILLSRHHRVLPFWLDVVLRSSDDLMEWNTIAADTTLTPMEGSSILRTDRISLSDRAFFRYESSQADRVFRKIPLAGLIDPAR